MQDLKKSGPEVLEVAGEVILRILLLFVEVEEKGVTAVASAGRIARAEMPVGEASTRAVERELPAEDVCRTSAVEGPIVRVSTDVWLERPSLPRIRASLCNPNLKIKIKKK